MSATERPLGQLSNRHTSSAANMAGSNVAPPSTGSTPTNTHHNKEHVPGSKKSSKPQFPVPDSIIVDKKSGKSWTRGEVLGEGGFARCYECTSSTGDKFAVKCVWKASLKSSKQRQKLVTEIRIHQMLSHPNIVGFKHVFEDDNFVYMILELCTNRTFVDLIKKRRRITEPEVRFWMWQLLDAVRHLHRKGVIHRDLKLGNLFLDENLNLKVGDFGLAAMIKHDGERKKTICGTPNYIAPEVLFDTANGHSFEVDIWSLGVVMYTLLVGKPPFQTKDLKSIYRKIKENQYSFPSEIPLSSTSKQLIAKLLNSNPLMRPSINDIMGHEFFAIDFPMEIPLNALTTLPTLKMAPTPNPNGETGIVSALDKLNLNMNGPGAAARAAQLAQSQKAQQQSGNQQSNSDEYFNENAIPSRSSSPSSNNKNAQSSIRPLPVLPSASSLGTSVARSKDGSSESNSGKKSQPALEQMLQTLNSAFTNPSLYTNEASQLPERFITKWIDYSNKYGLGYQLRDGSVGVYFNDSTTIILAADGFHFEYLYYDKVYNRTLMHRKAYNLETYPKDLLKKVTLLNHFKGYMQDNLFKAYQPASDMVPPTNNLDFLTKYLRTKHGVIFRLSNNLIQLNLFDHTKIMLLGDTITYMDEKRNLVCKGIGDWILEENEVVLERVRYLKDILQQMILKKHARLQQQQGSSDA